VAFKKVHVTTDDSKGFYLSITEDKNTKELSIKIFKDSVPEELIHQTSMIYMSKAKNLEISNEPIKPTTVHLNLGGDEL
jgi:hypothetical protein